ncbi:ribose-phosphate pyrophosphokinase [Marinobacter vulgaris]|uniref:ribose-phosphate diphosphokinase n=1 Tax=Marinobacter vulgaris TaxID=1928331 RepID=A0A2V3ZN23_9GAMM|nr:ribose-phosphate diphosphokinase [Marinobacter vulgaris]PXX92381.1 ribose-phosphate pyrophosphokinase [Marinobacter vulgaris]TSJ71675.1 ribose-phosphate pyrophosphokinase [Marinobacter vulgaris]
MHSEPVLFALEGSQAFGHAVATQLGVSLATQEDRNFEDGEHKSRPLQSMRGRDVYVCHTLFGEETASVNDKLLRLLFFIGTVKDAGAKRVTALVPYLAYARKDRRSKSQDPVTTRYVAQLFEAMGVDCVVGLEVHNQGAFDNAFRCRTVHLESHSLFVNALLDRVGSEPVVIVSPDAGGTKRVDRFRDAWADIAGEQPPTAFLEKRRRESGITGDAVVGDMTGRVAIIVDDMVASGTTLLRAAEACKNKGATRVFGVITHALFGPGSEQLYRAGAMDQLFITDSVTPQQQPQEQGQVTTLPVAGLFAQAVRELHTD